MSDDAQGPREPADPADTADSVPADRTPADRTPAAPEVDPRRRRRLLVLLVVVCVLAYVADQGTKWIALQQLADGRVVTVVDGWFSLRLLFNPGAAFSLGEGTTWLFTGVAVVVVAVIVRTSRRLGSTRWALALGFLLGGALGNLTDRLVREPGFARGHVIDFLAYADWFVGNVADVWIVGAAVAVTLLGLLGIGVDGTREKDQRAAKREPEDVARG